MINKILYILIAFLTILLLVILFFTFAPHLSGLFDQNNLPSEEEYQALLAQDTEKASDLLGKGDIRAALDIYDRLLAEAHDDSVRHRLIFHKANALFLLGELDTTKEAVDILGQALGEESASESFKAWALLSLFRYYHQTQSPEVLNHIRELTVFTDLRGSSDKDFLGEIVKRSNTLEPTMFGKLLQALPLVEELENMDNTDSPEAALIANDISKLVEESRNLQITETWLNDPFNQMLISYYRGLILAAATKGGTSPELARIEFESALSFVTAYPDVKPIEALAPMNHLHLAYLYLNYPDLDESGELFDMQMRNFIARVDDMKRFDLLVNNAMSNPNSRGYVMFSNLAAKSGEFRSYLQENYSITF